MKQGRTIEALAEEIQRQAKAKTDYVAPTDHLTFNFGPELTIGEEGSYPITDLAHSQIADKIGVPWRYYQRMRVEAPELLEENVNYWVTNKPEKRLVRLLDGHVRAFLSDRYRPLDNFDLAEAVLPTLVSSGASVKSCEITESRMYIKAVIDAVQVEVPAPEGQQNLSNQNVIVSPGIVIRNSEVGHSALAIQPAYHNLACTNMAIWAQGALRKFHLGGPGGKAGDQEQVWQYLSDETRQLSDAALWSQVKDLVTGALEGSIFDDIVKQLQAARGDSIRYPNRAVERLTNKYSLQEEEEYEGVLHYLSSGGDLSRYGLSQAITRFSQDVDNYDRATDLEELGGTIISLSRQDWRQLVN